MAWISKNWADRIADVTNTPEYHNAIISIIDPAIDPTEWDIDTNTPIGGDSQVVAVGIHARINWPLRSVSDPGTSDFDSTTIRSGRCQIDNAEYSGPLRTGMRIRVTDGGRSADLTRYLLTIGESLNSSWMVSRTFKVTADGQAVNS